MAETGANSHEVVLRLKPWMFLALVTCGHLLFAALCNPLGPNFTGWAEIFGLSVWYMQPVLFGQWLALGTGTLATRFQITVLLFALLVAIGGVSAGPGYEIDSEDVVIRVAEFLATAIIMTAFRRLAGWHVALAEPTTRVKSPIRFSIKSLLVWTTFWAVFLAIVRFLWTQSDNRIYSDWEQVAIGTSIYALIFGPLAFVAVSLLSTKWVSSLTVATAIIWPTATLALVIIAAIMEPSDSGFIATLIFISCGGTLTVCLTVLPLRYAGYRLLNRGSFHDRAASLHE